MKLLHCAGLQDHASDGVPDRVQVLGTLKNMRMSVMSSNQCQDFKEIKKGKGKKRNGSGMRGGERETKSPIFEIPRPPSASLVVNGFCDKTGTAERDVKLD